jgi:protein required for attachment to host cells
MQRETWILAADERAAHLFSREGDHLKPVSDFVAGENIEIEMNNNTIGRNANPGGQAQSYEPRMEQSRQWQVSFAQKIAATLNDAASREAFGRLIVVAPPKMLGYLRDCLDENVKSHVAAEVNKEVAHLPEELLRERLLDILADPDVMNQRLH